MELDSAVSVIARSPNENKQIYRGEISCLTLNPFICQRKAEYRSKDEKTAKPEKEKMPRNIRYTMCSAPFE